MDWLGINEKTKDMDMEWTSMKVEDFPCRFNKDDIIPIEKSARDIHSYKQPFRGPPRDTVDGILYRAAHSLHDAVRGRSNCREDQKKGEMWTRQAYSLSDKDLSFWKKTARYEIDRIADDDRQINFLIRELLKVITNTQRCLMTSQTCLNIRKTELKTTSDHINTVLENEIEFLQEMLKDLKSKVEELEKRLERLRSIRPYVQKDIQYKTVSASINQSCQHYDRLLLYRDPPDVAAETSNSQRLDFKLWNDNVNTLIKTSMDIRKESQNSCRSTEQMMQQLRQKLAEMWSSTNKYFSIEVEKNNDRLDRTRAELTAILYDIQLADQRLLSFRRSAFQENHPLHLTLWRQKRGNLRPPRELVCDRCNESIEDELKSSDMRISWIEKGIRTNEEVREELQTKRYHLEEQLDTICKHLFVDREYCQGLRRSVEVMSPSENFAKRLRFHPTPFPWRWHLLTQGTSNCVCY